MVWLYLAALIFGGSFTVPMLMGAFDTDTDVELDLGGDIDADFGGADFDAGGLDAGGIDADAGSGFDLGDADGLFDGAGDFALSLLSFRSLVFYSAFFGLVGLVFSAFTYAEPVPLITALILGFVAASMNSTLMSYLRKSEADSQTHERDLIGRPASIVVPLGAGSRGRIKVEIDGQPRFFVARALRESSDQIYSLGDSVVLCDFDNGTALVAPLPTHELEE